MHLIIFIRLIWTSVFIGFRVQTSKIFFFLITYAIFLRLFLLIFILSQLKLCTLFVKPNTHINTYVYNII